MIENRVIGPGTSRAELLALARSPDRLVASRARARLPWRDVETLDGAVEPADRPVVTRSASRPVPRTRRAVQP